MMKKRKLFLNKDSKILILILLSFLASGCSTESKNLSVVQALLKIDSTEAATVCAQARLGDTGRFAQSFNLVLSLDNYSGSVGIESPDDYFSINWISTSDEERNKQLASECNILIKSDKNFSQVFEQVLSKMSKKLQANIESEEREREKFEPLIQKWDRKFIDAGSGDVRDFLAASATTFNLIRQGAQYSLTGISRGEVQNSDCVPTVRSLWMGGVPAGWWSCSIDFAGGENDYYSIYFDGDSWSGVPDGGRKAGGELKNLEIPQDLLDWIRRD